MPVDYEVVNWRGGEGTTANYLEIILQDSCLSEWACYLIEAAVVHNLTGHGVCIFLILC